MHSPALSQIGQSMGWLTSRNSITEARALRTISVSVKTCMFSSASVQHVTAGRLAGKCFSARAFQVRTSAMHMRQFPSTGSPGW